MLRIGQFMGQTPTNEWTIFRERWLMGLHDRLGAPELRKLKEQYESEAEALFELGKQQVAGGDNEGAERSFRELIADRPFSELVGETYIALARMLVSCERYEEAKTELL